MYYEREYKPIKSQNKSYTYSETLHKTLHLKFKKIAFTNGVDAEFYGIFYTYTILYTFIWNLLICWLVYMFDFHEKLLLIQLVLSANR